MKRRISALLCFIICIAVALTFPVSAYAAEQEVIVGGMLFGARMHTDGVLVVGLDKVSPMGSGTPKAPAYDAGLRLKDIITEINGKTVIDSQTVTKEIEASDGKAISIKIKRGKTEKQFSVTPIKSKEGQYKIGIWIRDEAAGIGTVTYILPETGEFAGLGHGICDGDTGMLLPIKRGIVSDAELIGIIKGQKGVPGELKGIIDNEKIGSLIKNTDHGVYGIYVTVPKSLTEKMKTADKNEIKEGKALLRSSVSGKIEDYEIDVSKLNRDSGTNKNFVVTITDPRLLELTGGIVQGLSGSPIIQNGKLIGAVTHVTVNDPTKGYGIFIENMLS